VGYENAKPNRRRFQFSLRELLIFTTICGVFFSGVAIVLREREIATKPPIEVLSAWLKRDPNHVCASDEPILTMKIEAKPWIGYTKQGVKYTYEQIDYVMLEIKMFDQSGKDITEIGETGPMTIDHSKTVDLWWHAMLVIKPGETITVENRFQSSLPVAIVKGCVLYVRLDGVPLGHNAWTPPADHPITFEARLKPEDEKAEKTKAKQ